MFAWCPSGTAWFQERAWWQDGSYEPRPGDIIFFDWDDPDTDGQDGSSDHVGIVERVENGYVYTVPCVHSLFPFIRQKKIPNIPVLNPIAAHVELIQRHNIFRVVISDVIVNAKLPIDCFL